MESESILLQLVHSTATRIVQVKWRLVEQWDELKGRSPDEFYITFKKGECFFKLNKLDELPQDEDIEIKIKIKKAGRGHSAKPTSICSSTIDNRTTPERKVSHIPNLPIDDLLNPVGESNKIAALAEIAERLNHVRPGEAADLRSYLVEVGVPHHVAQSLDARNGDLCDNAAMVLTLLITQQPDIGRELLINGTGTGGTPILKSIFYRLEDLSESDRHRKSRYCCKLFASLQHDACKKEFQDHLTRIKDDLLWHLSKIITQVMPNETCSAIILVSALHTIVFYIEKVSDEFVPEDLVVALLEGFRKLNDYEAQVRRRLQELPDEVSKLKHPCLRALLKSLKVGAAALEDPENYLGDTLFTLITTRFHANSVRYKVVDIVVRALLQEDYINPIYSLRRDSHSQETFRAAAAAFCGVVDKLAQLEGSFEVNWEAAYRVFMALLAFVSSSDEAAKSVVELNMIVMLRDLPVRFDKKILAKAAAILVRLCSPGKADRDNNLTTIGGDKEHFILHLVESFNSVSSHPEKAAFAQALHCFCDNSSIMEYLITRDEVYDALYNTICAPQSNDVYANTLKLMLKMVQERRKVACSKFLKFRDIRKRLGKLGSEKEGVDRSEDKNCAIVIKTVLDDATPYKFLNFMRSRPRR